MKSFVVTIKDDVCARNGRDPEGAKLIEIAKTFGSVEPLDSVLASERAKYQIVNNNLMAQLDEIKENKVTPEELEVLRAIRKKAATESATYEEAIKTRDDQLKAIQIENENRAAQIKSIFGIA